MIEREAFVLKIILRALQHALFGKRRELLAQKLELTRHHLPQVRALAQQPRAQLHLIRHGELRRVGRRCRTHIGDKVADGHVRLVPDGGDDRQLGIINCPRHALIVERPQILDRPAAAPGDDKVGNAVAVCIADRSGDLGRRLRALHAHGQKLDLHQRIAPVQDAQHIHHRRARAGGDDGDRFGVRRQLFLVRRVKQPLCLQFLLELLKGDVQVAHAVGREAVAVELIRPVARKHAHAPGGDDLHAVLRAKAQPQRRIFEHHAAQRAAFVLERKIMMPGGVNFIVADLAAHGKRGQMLVPVK